MGIKVYDNVEYVNTVFDGDKYYFNGRITNMYDTSIIVEVLEDTPQVEKGKNIYIDISRFDKENFKIGGKLSISYNGNVLSGERLEVFPDSIAFLS